MIADRIVIENNEIIFRLDIETTGANAAEIAVRARDEAQGYADQAETARYEAVDARDEAVQKGNEAVNAASQAIDAKDEVEIIGNQVSEDRIAVAGDRSAVELARADVEEKAGIAEQAAEDSVQLAGKFNSVLLPGKNLFDKETMTQRAKSWHPTNSILANSSVGIMAIVPVDEGETYNYSGFQGSVTGGYLTRDLQGVGLDIQATGSPSAGFTFTVPVGSNIGVVALRVSATTVDDNTYVDTFQLEKGTERTTYEPYTSWGGKVRNDSLEIPVPANLNQRLGNLEADNLANTSFISSNFYYSPGKNLFNKATARPGKYWSPSNSTIGNNAAYILAVIPVEEGEQYTISGGQSQMYGGYIDANENGVENIVSVPTTGNGRTFTVPTGLGIKSVAINISFTNSTDDTYVDAFQLEKSDVATPYEPFNETLTFKGKAEVGGGTTPTPAPSPSVLGKTYLYPGIHKHFPNFTDRFHKKDKDVTLCMNGTSLLRNSYSTTRSDASIRPPLMDQNTLATWLWDKLEKQWTGQQYRRYDVSGFFAETGTFITETGNANWDDNGYRIGHTRWSSSTDASVQFDVPSDSWQFNFIYRTEQAGTEQARVAISEGNGLMEAWNGSDWVEANGFIFSMKEPATTTTKGNTTYQKRLKMRCKSGTINSIGTTKSVTINNQSGTGRFLYWGVEWSPREFMFTIVNSSRGSHNWGTGTRNLIKFQDNEMWSFKPDLVLFEITMINYGGSTFNRMVERPSNYYIDLIDNSVFNLENTQSLAAKSDNFNNCEALFFMDTPSILSAGWEEDGTLKFGVNADGKVQTVMDNFIRANGYMFAKDVAFVDVFSRFVEYAEANYPSFFAAMQGSGSSSSPGNTLSRDGTHWNHTGNRLVADILLPAFDFN